MSFFKTLFAAKSVTPNKARLGLESLSAREVPATLNTAITPDLNSFDFTPVFDTSRVFGKIEASTTTAGVVNVSGTSGSDRVTINEVNGDVVVVLQQLNASGAVTSTQTASFDANSPPRFFVDLGAGNDTFVNNADVFTHVNGGDGIDNLTASDGANYWDAGAGDDRMRATGGSNVWHGGAGDDTMSGGGVSYGDAGDDTIFGTNGGDILHGGDGNDYINAGDGNDWVWGGDGNDLLIGGGGIDILVGGGGDDQEF